ncbi:MAG: homoserine O-acetyltransferase [Kiritimatiellaceae bacterium]|nr:homoserine O-acetyltransferase [Kiritimatiellaceae bacterium]
MQQIETQFFTYDSLKLQTGETLGPVKLAYETYGELNEARDNAILLFHALTGSQHAVGFNPTVPGVGERWNTECQTGWWKDFIGPGKAIDTDRFFIVCANYIGGCYGSTGPSSINPKVGVPYGGSFPRIHFSDIVDSQLPLLEHLGIDNLYAVIGASLGGNLTLNFATRYPERVNRVIPIACGLQSTTLTRAHNLEQILAIENDPNFCNGNFYDGPPPIRGLALARMISHKTFVSLSAIEERAQDRFEQEHDEFSWYKIRSPIESFLLHQGRKLVRRFDANSYIQFIAAWSDHDILKDSGFDSYTEVFAACRHQKYLVISISDDVCFYPSEQEEIRDRLTENGIDCKYLSVPSDKGHDSFLLEPDLYTAAIQDALVC